MIPSIDGGFTSSTLAAMYKETAGMASIYYWVKHNVLFKDVKCAIYLLYIDKAE